MAEFQWWLLLVGLVAGGGLVAIVSMDSRRRDEDLADAERAAEATWIADRLYAQDPSLEPELGALFNQGKALYQAGKFAEAIPFGVKAAAFR